MRLAAMRRFLFSILVFSILALAPRNAPSMNPRATLEQLRSLEILCYVPGWLPKDLKLKSIALTYDEPGPDEGSVGRFPLYFIKYAGPNGTSFTIDSAREGIGDRNLLDTEDSEETQITSPFGPMYLIYTPKGQGNAGRKKEIKANWASDSNMKSEKAKDRNAHPVLGRYHGFSATGITIAEFEKIIQSLKPLRHREAVELGSQETRRKSLMEVCRLWPRRSLAALRRRIQMSKRPATERRRYNFVTRHLLI